MKTFSACDLILVAGGLGARFDGLKQLELVCGKPVYQWSLQTFLKWPSSGRAVVVVPETAVDLVRGQIVSVNEFARRVEVAAGGLTRFQSAARGFAQLQKVPVTFPGNTLPQKPTGTSGWVMIHDAARPCLTESLLNRLWGARDADFRNERVAGVIPGLPVRSSGAQVGRIAEASESLILDDTLAHASSDGDSRYSIQTPQLFKRNLLSEAYGDESGAQAVDDSSLLENRGFKVVVVPGECDNLKITFREDIARVSDWLRQRHT